LSNFYGTKKSVEVISNTRESTKGTSTQSVFSEPRQLTKVAMPNGIERTEAVGKEQSMEGLLERKVDDDSCQKMAKFDNTKSTDNADEGCFRILLNILSHLLKGGEPSRFQFFNQNAQREVVDEVFRSIWDVEKKLLFLGDAGGLNLKIHPFLEKS